jgi:integrase
MGQKKSPKQKASKGEVSITNAEGVVRLRWRYQDVRYSLNLPYEYKDYNLPKASICAAQIKLDIIQGAFDATLEKYRVKISPIGQVKGAVNGQETMPNMDHEEKGIDVKMPELLNELVGLFNLWAASIRNVDVSKSETYLILRGLLIKWGEQPIESLPVLLGGQNWSASTYNGRLSYFRIFTEYLINKGKIACNPLAEVKRKKKSRNASSKREPLNDNEVLTFLDAIKTDRFVPKCSRYKHAHYYNFFAFIFQTGVRNAEAVGLRVRHINSRLKQVEISEVFARTAKGTNHAARVRKGTKTENVRYLPLPDELMALLEPLISGRQPDELVFLSPKGLSIDDRMLQRRVFKPVMKALGYGDKDLYVARHSFGTRAIEQGMSPTGTAYLMGHSTVETAMRNYVSVRKAPNDLPSINKSIE